MSTSLLYHSFGVRGYTYVKTRHVDGTTIFTIRKPAHLLRCSLCDSPEVYPRGYQERTFKALPIGPRATSITLAIPRVECPSCKVVRQVNLHFADPRRTYTKAFERFVLDLSRHMTIQDVAEHLNVGWDLVKDIQKRHLHRRFANPKLKNLRRMAIDEICIGKGHRYLTVVLNLETGVVVFVGNGKGGDALATFWLRLRRSHAKVQAVAMDMSPAYIAAVKENLKGVAIVFDHFHVIKLFNEKLSNFRRELYRTALEEHKKILKGTRWLLLKNPENLNVEKNEKQRLEEALALNQPLAIAYYLKEDLRQFWSQLSKPAAAKFLKDWRARAIASGISMLKKFAQTLLDHWAGLLAYYASPISTGPLEGTNNKIKTMSRQAYGFRDPEFFKLKILGIHETKYALVG